MYLLSVIIPVYNAVQYIDTCIDSILRSVSQNLNCVEIILVDDGSTDKSDECCKRYAEIYSNIHLFQKENGGVASARNLGLKYATGKYIAWVDPDDFVAPEWFSEIYAAITRESPDVIVIDTVRFDQNGERPEIYGRPEGLVDRDVFVEDVVRDVRMLSGLPNKVMKSILFQDVQFDSNLPILEDYAAMPYILRSARSVYYIPKYLYHYRQHEGSLLHSAAEANFLAVEVALEREKIVEGFCRKAAVTASAIQVFIFCRSCYLQAAHEAADTQVLFCERYIRKHLITLLMDKELSVSMRLKILLLGLGIYPLICRAKTRRTHKLHSEDENV